MKLLIQENVTNRHIDDTYSLAIEALKFKATHMFIASSIWDSIYIYVNDHIDAEDVKYLHSICDNIYCVLPTTVNDKVLAVLCSIYPDLAGELRLAYMLSKDLSTILPKEVT